MSWISTTNSSEKGSVMTFNKLLLYNLSKHTYWDEPVGLRDFNNAPLGTFAGASSDYALGLTGTAHYFITERISVGTGLGAQLFTLTASRLTTMNGQTDEFALARTYRQLLPMIPVELAWKGRKLLYNIRYEHGLSNRYKSGLADFKTDRFGLLYFELGFKL